MNISEVQKQIADNEAEVAELHNWTIPEMRRVRWWFQSASNNARVAVPAAARRDMKAQHQAEIAEMRVRHAAEIAAFDPERAVREHIAKAINMDVASIPDLMQGFAWMDQVERQLWADYRGQGHAKHQRDE